MGITLVSSAPPFVQEENTNGLQIFEPKIEYLPQNIDYDLHIHLSNITNGLQINNADADCNLHLYNSTGSHTFEGDMEKDGNGIDYDLLINSGNFSDIGEHTYFIYCNSTSAGGDVKGTFMVTEGGVEFTEGRAILINGLLFLLVVFVFLSLFAMFMIENYIGKFTLYWISHVLLILTTFVAWQIGVDGVFSSLAITGIFRIMFWVLTVGVVPMIFLSVAWVVYIHLFNEHFQKLVDKGMTTEEAFKIANKKRGGWFNGQ